MNRALRSARVRCGWRRDAHLASRTFFRALPVVVGCSIALAACGSRDQGIDNATRVSVFADLSATTERLLRVPDPYRAQAPSPADDLAASADKIRRTVGNGLAEVGTRYVLDDAGRPIAALQVVVFSALAPTGSAAQFAAGIEELNGPFDDVSFGGVPLRASTSYRLWVRERDVVVFAVIEPASVDELVARYVARHG